MKVFIHCTTSLAISSCLMLVPVSAQAAGWAAGAVGGDYLIRNTDAGINPVVIDGSDNAAAINGETLVVSAKGNLGLGAYPPDDELSARLYIYDPTPEIELDDSDNAQTWQIYADGGDGGSDPGEIAFADVTAKTIPFSVQSAAPTDSLRVDASGKVGLGIFSPEYNLHVKGDGVGDVSIDTERVLLLESTLAPEQIFTNTTTGATWYFAMVSNNDFKVSLDGTGKVEARFKPNGNLRIAGTLIQNSDRDSKKNIVDVDGEDILDRVARLPISSWEYKADTGVKHVGPMAQDFYAAFGLGNSPKSISTIDTGGIALAAIKGLRQEKDQQLQQLREAKDNEIALLRSQLEHQDARMLQLEMALGELMRERNGQVQLGSTR